jgi:hypothetical protein
MRSSPSWLLSCPERSEGRPGRNAVRWDMRFFRIGLLTIMQIRTSLSDTPAHSRDASRSSRNVGPGCDGRCGVRRVRSPDEYADSVRRNRVVLAPRPWRYAGWSSPAGNGGKKGRFPGESAYKPSNHCVGKAGMSRLYLSNPCAFLLPIAHGDAGAVGARLSLRLSSERSDELAKLRRNRVVRMSAHVFSRVPDAVQRATLLRRAGTHISLSANLGPGSAAHRFALRCVRGTRVIKSAFPYTASTPSGRHRPGSPGH